MGRRRKRFFFFSSRRRHTRSDRDWSSDVCSSDLECRRRRRLADEYRLRLGPAGSRTGPLHGNAYLHGDRTMMAAATSVAAASLSVSPVHIRLTRAASRTITITNAGDASAAVDARPAGFVLDRRGKPTIARERQRAAGWIRLRPRRFVLAPGGTAVVTVSFVAPPGALPGDHPSLVLFTTRPPRAAGVAIRV